MTDDEILDRHRAALVAVADVLAGERPGTPGPNAARKVIFMLHNRGLLVDEPPADDSCGTRQKDPGR